MTTEKREHSTADSAPVVLYAKTDRDSITTYPILQDSVGKLLISNGLSTPSHDQQVIDEADPDNVIITYKLNGVTVGTKTIAVSGTTTTITVA